MSDFLHHEPCPKCGSKDNLSRYSDGHGWCFTTGCGYFEPATDKQTQHNYEEETQLETKGFISDIPERKISKKIASKFGVRVTKGTDGKIDKHYYPYYDSKTGDLVGYKVRNVATKDFTISGTNRGAGLFGQNVYKEGGNRYLTITEGELDALSVAEMFDGKWASVSLKNGAQSAVKDIKDNLEYVESFEYVVLCFDQDEPGLAAIKAVRDIISPNKLRICTLPMKDASDMLMAGSVKDFTECWYNAKPYTPEGIISAADTWEYLKEEEDIESIPYPWMALNEVTYGFRPKELVTLTSGTGMGKTSVVKELEHYLINNTEDNIGILHLEESISKSAEGIMSVEYNIPLHIPTYKSKFSKQERYNMWYKAVGQYDGRLFFFDHFGSIAEDSLINRIRAMAKGMDCQWIILDHLSIVVSDQEGFLDERKAIDSIMTKLRKLVQETGIGLFVVSHLKRPVGKSHEEGGQVSLSELRGSSAIAQLSDMVIGLERNQQADDEQERNTTTLRVIKNRFAGLTGKAGSLLYNKDTGRLKEI